jgi:hypothetical protein
MRAPLLRRIAQETGGRFYTAAHVASLPEDIAYTGRGITTQEEKDLWDMPRSVPAAGRCCWAASGLARARGLA